MKNIAQPVAYAGLSAQLLKLIAIAAMTVDHIAWAFVDSNSIAGILMHLVGRLTAPIMCFFIAEGYAHTRSVKRYAARLLIFSLVSWFPFLFFQAGGLPHGVMWFQMNMIFTLLLGLTALWIWDQVESGPLRVMITIALCLLSALGDWPIFGVLYILAFGRARGDFQKQAAWFSAVSAGMLLFCLMPYWTAVAVGGVTGFQPTLLNFLGEVGIHAGVFLALPLLSRYNGEKGGGKGSKWLFYLYYPIHLLIIGGLKYLLL